MCFGSWPWRAQPITAGMAWVRDMAQIMLATMEDGTAALDFLFSPFILTEDRATCIRGRELGGVINAF